MNDKKCHSVILNYNTFDDTKELTLNLLKTDAVSKIVIIDNNSSDNSFIKLKKLFKDYEDIFVLKTSENLGYSYGNNYGVKFILKNFKTEYILISNPDVEIPKNFVKCMINYLENDPKLASVTGIMLNYEKKINFSKVAFRIPNLFDYILMNLDLFMRIYNPIEYKNFDMQRNNYNIKYVECLPGSCFVIKSDVLSEIEFFDDNVFLYCEEIIMGKKIKNLGLTNGVSLTDFFIHKHYKKRDFKEELKHYLFLYKSRFYYVTNYTKFGKLLSPVFILTLILGILEKIVILCLISFNEKIKSIYHE